MDFPSFCYSFVAFCLIYYFILDPIRENLKHRKWKRERSPEAYERLIEPEDDTLLRLKQQQEDFNHYSHFAQQKREDDYNRLSKEYLKTHEFLRSEYGKKKSLLTVKDFATRQMLESKEKYDQYDKMCDELLFAPRLTFEEFYVKEKNLLHCVEVQLIRPFRAIYQIHHPASAKYAEGDMRKKMEEEFKKEYY